MAPVPRALGLALVLLAVPAAAEDPLARARALDREGVRAFQDGRYRDALRYFEDALALGGPASELWNAARCHQRLDEPELADEALARYAARGDVSAGDRREAERLRKELRARPSPLTVTSAPARAFVAVDGRPAGAAPVTVEVAPGPHKVLVRAEGFAQREETVTAQWGRAIVIDAALEPQGAADSAAPRARRFSIEAGLGPSFGWLGAFGADAFVHGYAEASYAVVDLRRAVFGVGLRLAATGDSWGATVASPSPAGCALPASFSQAELAAQLLVIAGAKLGERARVGLEVGGGVAGSTAGDRVGGDVYAASCSASQGVRPALHASLDASYRVLPPVRLVVRPLAIDVHPAFDGARVAPVDASGAWVRLAFAAGVALDF